jgi:RNA polymerase sigma-54 factor
MLDQKMQLRLLQKLSPQQIQLMKLLQLPAIALEQRVKQELEENPALEMDDEEPLAEEQEINDEFGDSDVEKSDEQSEIDEEKREEELAREEISIEDYIDDDDIPYYKLQTNNTSPDEEDDHRENRFTSSISFQELLFQQLGMRKLDERQFAIAAYIIGNLDDSGYLGRELNAIVDDLAFSQNIFTNKEELLEILMLIQEFEPYGVGARDLRECLMIQLERKEEQTPAITTALNILSRHFKEFTKKHYDKIAKKAELKPDELKDAINEILKLNPKPGNSLVDSTKPDQYIVPDFQINVENGKLELTLNSRNMPDLRINRTFAEMIETYGKDKAKTDARQRDVLVFVKQKLDSAKWFIDMIKQRQETLYKTMSAIMQYQKEYFLLGDETKLRPMILKDIAEVVSLDISTISRVANSKYVQTPYGTFLLKSFFSESLQNQEGEEVSTREVKKILTDCVSAENKRKPVTDEQLMNILKEKGYNIARRTVAKYREILGIPVARLRKEL